MSAADSLIIDKDASEEITGDEEDEDVGFQDIIMLLDYGILLEDIKRLQTASINTIKGVQMTTRKSMLKIEGFDINKVNKIYEACLKIPASPFLTALEVLEGRKQVFKLSTGSKNLDELLGGGIESMAITEIFGEFGTGKTQIAHTLCVTAQIAGSNGYTGGKVFFIDTEHTFRPELFHNLADRFNLDFTKVSNNIVYARAYTSEHQYYLLKVISDKLHEEAGVFKLLIIDSIMALFRVDYSGMGEMGERQRNVGKMMSQLQKISEEYNIAIFLTNQVTSDFSRPDQPDLHKPVGGHILAHASTVRVSLHKQNENVRLAKIFDSPNLPCNETKFVITNAGISDN